MKKISVIIPNYNGYKYSDRCLEALEKQTFKDFEVCIVDDCSTDDSYEKLRLYAEQSPLSIKVLQSPSNMGPGHARQQGIESTESEWVAFCDIDDWYDEDFLEVQLSNAEKNNADLVLCDNTFVYKDNRRIKANVTCWTSARKVEKKTMLALGKMSLCRLMCKRYLFDHIIFPDIYYGEDAPVTIQLISKSSKQYVDNNAHYNYYIRDNSASSNPQKRAVEDYQKGFDIIYNAINSDYPNECEYIGVNMILYGKTLIMNKTNCQKEDIIATIRAFEDRFPNWENNVYLSELNRSKIVYLWAIKKRLLCLCYLFAGVHSYLVRRKA